MRFTPSFLSLIAGALSAAALWIADAAPAQAAETPMIVASVSNSSLAESVGAVKVRLTLENPPDSVEEGEGYTGCRLRLGSGSVATTPADVTFSNQKKLNPSNGWSAEAKLMTVVDDTLVEGDESLVVEGHCTGSKPGTQPSHEELASRPLTLTIQDDDEPGAIKLSASPNRIAENGGEQAVTVTAETEAAPSAAVTVSLDLGSGSYAVTGTQTIEITGGATSGSTTLTFTPSNDGNTSDDSVTIDGSAPGYTVSGASLTIEEPPAGPPPRLVASVGSSVLLESAGQVDVRLTLENPPDTAADDEGYTGCRLRLGAGGDADSPADVTFSNQKKLNAGNGWTAEAGLLTVVDDAVVEGDESLVVEGHCTGTKSGTQPSHGDLQSVPLTLTIRDNDFRPMTLSVNPDRIGEKNGAQAVVVSAATDHAPASGATVDLDLGPGAYEVSGTQRIEIAANATRGSTTLTFTPHTDGNLKDDEVVVDGYASGYTITATKLTIVEPPPGPPPRIVASVAASKIRESAGRVNARLTLENPPEVLDDYVGYTGCRLRLGAGGEATEPADVTFSNQKKLNPGNGWTAEAGLLTVVDDTLVEGDETLVVEGYCTGDNGGPDPPHSKLESVPLTLTIEDNDEPTVALSVNPDRIGEDLGAQTVTVTASTQHAPESALTVNLDLGAGAYEVSGARTIAINANSTRGSTTLTFEPTDDGNATDDAVSIDGSASGYLVTGATLTVEEPAVGPTPRIVASVADSTLSESADRVNVRLTLDHPPEGVEGGYTGCRLRLGAGGEAEEPADVVFQNQKKLNPSNGWSAEAWLLRVVDDDTFEGDETLVVEGYCTGTNQGVKPSHADLDFMPLTLTIEDNDLPAISLTTSPKRIREGGGAQAVTVTARAEKAPERGGAMVHLEFGSGSFTVTGSRSILIDQGERSGSETLTIEPADDGNRINYGIAIGGNAEGYRVNATQLIIQDSENAIETPTALAPLFLNAMDPFRQGFVRVVNRSSRAGEARLTAIDDTGYQPDSLSIRLAAHSAIHLNSKDVENGNSSKGLADGVGPGTGEWRLLFHSDLDIEVLTYVRTRDGFLTALHDVAPTEQGVHRVAMFNPGSNVNQVSTLRVVNVSSETADVSVKGYDQSNISGAVVRFDVPANQAREYTAAELEGGVGLTGSLGSGTGKWRLEVESEQPILVMSLLESPEGRLTNLSSIPAPPARIGGAHPVPLFPSASDRLGRQGFVRLINRSPTKGDVRVQAFDQSGTDYTPLTVALDAWETAHFNSDDLELGSESKGLTGSTGSGNGDWRLELTSALDVDVLSYVRTPGGFLTSMHDLVPSVHGVYEVATFNPASNFRQVSRLLMINPQNRDANVEIEGVDDSGASPGGTVKFTLAAGSARTLDGSQLESGGDGLSGKIGDGAGKWRLNLEADQAILVVNLLLSPTGHISNLSSVPSWHP